MTISFDSNTDQKATLQVLDINGRYIHTIKATGNAIVVDMAGYAPGMYLIRYSDNGQQQTIKIFRQ